MTIGERIEARRIELGMTQEELAQKLGYKSRSSINKIEMGVNKLTQSKIADICMALDTTPEYIMGWEEDFATRISNTQKHFVELCNRLAEKMYPVETAIEKVLSINTEEEFWAITKFRDLDEEDQKMVLSFIETLLMKDKYKKDKMEGGEVG